MKPQVPAYWELVQRLARAELRGVKDFATRLRHIQGNQLLTERQAQGVRDELAWTKVRIKRINRNIEYAQRRVKELEK